MKPSKKSNQEEDYHEAFLQHLFAEFRDFCISHDVMPSTANLLDYLLRQGVIPQAITRKYVLLLEFKELVAKNRFPSKTQTVVALANKYGVHENTLWNLLKDQKGRF